MKKPLLYLIIISIAFFSNNITSAYFSDNKTSEPNNFKVGSLDFSLKEGNLFLNGVTPQQSGYLSFVMQKTGNLNFQYQIRALNPAGELCDYLNLEARLNGDVFSWQGSPSDFSDHVLEAQNPEAWFFDFSLNNTNKFVQNKSCYLRFVFDAWQANLENNSQGFTKTKELIFTVHSGNWETGVFLNEFLPNPSELDPNYGFDFGVDSDNMPQGEWIELYNNSDHSINIANWYFKDIADHIIFITSENTNPATTTINAYSWLVAYMNQSILNNSASSGSPADTIYLYDNENNLIDSYAYYGTNCELEPTPGEDNPLTPPSGCNTILSVPGNKSYARIPDGSGKWYDPIPTPGFSNTLKSFNCSSLSLREATATKQSLCHSEQGEESHPLCRPEGVVATEEFYLP